MLSIADYPGFACRPPRESILNSVSVLSLGSPPQLDSSSPDYFTLPQQSNLNTDRRTKSTSLASLTSTTLTVLTTRSHLSQTATSSSMLATSLYLERKMNLKSLPHKWRTVVARYASTVVLTLFNAARGGAGWLAWFGGRWYNTASVEGLFRRSEAGGDFDRNMKFW